jgi:hypothetical protein
LTVGPLRNGAPCRSATANDPLEGMQVRLVKRVAALSAAPVWSLEADAGAQYRATGRQTN